MARGRFAVLVPAVFVLAAVCRLRRPAFVPPPARRAALAALPAAAAAAASAPALAAGSDAIGKAAVELSNAAYPFLKEVDWNSGIFYLRPGPASAGDWARAIDKAIAMGISMDPELLKAGVQAHHRAIPNVNAANPVTSKEAFTAINAAIGRMVASVPESQTMDVYNAFSKLVSPEVPPYLMSQVNEADAKKAYEAFLKFKDVVKQNPITPKDAMPTSVTGDTVQIEAAAKKLSSAAYPFLKEVSWDSNIYLTPLPGVPANTVLKAIDKALVLGTSMDSKLLQEAAQAHRKAIASMDAKLVTTEADFTAVNAAIGKLIATAPSPQVLATYNAFAGITAPDIPSKMISLVNPLDALKAYQAFWQFKDVVAGAAGQSGLLCATRTCSDVPDFRP